MNLNRNNYEEYFLLYADGELSKAGCEAVEAFVLKHPDLADELLLLKDAVLEIDAHIEMPGKETLLKSVAWNEEELTTIQQEMLLFMDNELSNDRVKDLQLKLNNDAVLRMELLSLQQTKLVAETVEMPNKEVLYNHESKRRGTIIPIVVARWMAAAAIIAGLGWFFISKFDMKTTPPATMADVDIKVPDNTPSEVKNSVAETPANRNVEKQINGTVAAQEPIVRKVNVNGIGDKLDKEPTRKAATNEQPQMAANNPKRDVFTKLVGVRDNQMDESKHIATIAPSNIETSDLQNPIASNALQTEELPKDLVAHQAVHQEDDPSNESFVNIGGARINKQKIRGLFRNVTRTVGRSIERTSLAQAVVAYNK